MATSQSQSNAGAWKVVAAIACVSIVGGASTRVRDASALAITAGIAVFVVGVIFAVWSIRQLLHDNRGHRIPWWGTPPVKPRSIDVAKIIGIPTTMLGVLMIGENMIGGESWWTTAILAGLAFLALACPIAIHNLRVDRHDKCSESRR